MEPISVILASLFSLISPVGIVGDRLADQAIRQQLAKVESLQVRVDNVPTYQILSGKIDKVWFAGRGLFLTPEFRVDTLELETDPIHLAGLQAKLAAPLQGAFRLKLTETDINRALASPQVTDRLKNIGTGSATRKYQILSPQIHFLPDQRIEIKAKLIEAGYPDKLDILVQAQLTSKAGKIIQLDKPTFFLNQKPISPIVLKQLFPSGLPGYDLTQLEAQNITARILNLDLQPNGELQMVGFLQVRPAAQPTPQPPVQPTAQSTVQPNL